MYYQEKAPKPPLDLAINCFWMIESDNKLTVHDRTFPDGCQEIIFNIDTQVLRDDGRGFTANPTVELVGQMTRPYDIITAGKQLYFGIKFFPHSFSLFTKESIHDLRDQSIDLRALFSHDINEIIDDVMENRDFCRFVEVAHTYFNRKLQQFFGEPRRGYALVDQSVRAMFSESETSIDAIAKHACVSERYLQQCFRHHVGLTPKQLWKMIRFQRTFKHLQNTSQSLTEIAHHCGYYDQAHFANSFSALAGISPSGYRKMEAPLNGFFLLESSLAYLCNYPSN